MTLHERQASRGRRLWLSLAVTLPVVGWWGLTAWISRDVRPWAIAWTAALFAVGLAASYLATWVVAWIGAREQRVVVFRAATVTMSLLMLVVILESMAVVRLVDYATLWRFLVDETREPTSFFLEDREFSFRRPANLSWSGRPRSPMARSFGLPIRSPHTLTFTTNALGFRNRSNVNHAEVTLVGDSYIEGEYVSDEETAAVALERLTGQPVTNLGVSGYGTLQELLVLERYALPLTPKFIAWFFFEGNDLYNDQDYENALVYYRDPAAKLGGLGQAKAPAGAIRDWQSFTRASFTVNAFDLLRSWAHSLIPKTVADFGWFRDSEGHEHRMYFYPRYAALRFGDFERSRFEITKAAILKGVETARKQGIRLTLFFIPLKFRVYGDFCQFPAGSPCLEWKPWNLADHFMRFCADAGLACVDLTVSMRHAAKAGQVLYAPEDSHWTRQGHEFVARQVLQAWKTVPDP
jgi:hypothetical protein